MPVILLLAAASADAAEVVWLAPADPAAIERVATVAGATGKPLLPLELRAAGNDFGPADEAAYKALEGTLRDVRQYETQLDGELVIMDELAGPIAKIGVIRNEADRGALFSALAYQGFAVDRYFADGLATDPKGANYRVEYEGLTLERPWADAVALDPTREVTPYEIAEAPQRVAYATVSKTVNRQLPARVVPSGLPAGSKLIADGRELLVGPSGAASLVPGRHLVHVELDGHVIARWDLRVVAGEKIDLPAPLSDAAFAAFIDGLGTTSQLPKELEPAIQALGGEVWLADPRDGLKVWKVTPGAITAVELPKVKDPDEDDGGLSIAVGVGGGWLSTGDFYTQDPSVPRTVGTVNAPTAMIGVGADYDAGPLRFGAGVDAAFTIGANHVALYGDAGKTRFRTAPYVAIGVPYAQALLGYAFPHHPLVGARATVPLGELLELRGTLWYGLATDRTRDDGTVFEGDDLIAVSAGVGVRL